MGCQVAAKKVYKKRKVHFYLININWKTDPRGTDGLGDWTSFFKNLNIMECIL